MRLVRVVDGFHSFRPDERLGSVETLSVLPEARKTRSGRGGSDMTRGRTGSRIIRSPVTEDADQTLKSLSTLAATKAKTVLPGHGEPWPHGIDSAVEVARRRGR